MRKPYACQSLSAHLLASTTRFTMPVRHGCSFGPMHAPALIFVTLPCTLNCRVRCIWHNVVCLFRAFFRHDAQQWPDGKMDAMCCWLSLSLGWLLLHATAIPSQLFVLLDAILSGPHTLSSICPFPYTMDAGCLFYSDGFRTCRVVAPPCYLDHSFVPTINTCSSHISASHAAGGEPPLPMHSGATHPCTNSAARAAGGESPPLRAHLGHSHPAQVPQLERPRRAYPPCPSSHAQCGTRYQHSCLPNHAEQHLVPPRVHTP